MGHSLLGRHNQHCEFFPRWGGPAQVIGQDRASDGENQNLDAVFSPTFTRLLAHGVKHIWARATPTFLLESVVNVISLRVTPAACNLGQAELVFMVVSKPGRYSK